MFGNWIDNLSSSPGALVGFVVTLVVFLVVLRKAYSEWKTYLSLEFMGWPSRIFGIGAAALLIIQLAVYSQPYQPDPSDQIAIVVGNTQNSPDPAKVVSSESVKEQIESTLLLHKGESVDEWLSAITIVSAIGEPNLIELSAFADYFKKIRTNRSNAKDDVDANLKTITNALNCLSGSGGTSGIDCPADIEPSPSGNGANYLEAILIAKQNVNPGSNIIVIGSGLSDSGDLNFSKSKLIRNVDEEIRAETIDSVVKKFGRTYLNGYNVTFIGLGYVVPPQETLDSKQRENVRNVYKEVINALGGNTQIITRTTSGQSVMTKFTVNTTDTGCGLWVGQFDESSEGSNESIRFVGGSSSFTKSGEDEALAALQQVIEIYETDREAVTSIKVDGYIANYPGWEKLAGERAAKVKALLVSKGVPSELISAEGKGFGPYDSDERNRMVRITVSRDNEGC